MPKAFSYVRFSTPDQAKGDSYRRQVALSRRYADEYGLDLDEALTYRDEGVSAFRGKNVQAGALGEFMAAVKAGLVPSGSYLLVESLDRLSRDKALWALEQLSSILRLGIVVVTLLDGKTYTAESLADNPIDLIISILIMSRAHEESATKSHRLKATWENKRDLAAREGKPLTATCPAWLNLNKETGEYDLVEQRAAVVQRIFQMALEGLGKGMIAKRFNEEGLPPFSMNGTGWHHSYIFKVLTNPATYGAFQPHRRAEVNGKRRRVPEGELLREYFPPVISEADFLRVQQIARSRALPPGPKGKRLSNLFTGLAFCGLCGATMRLVNKGKPPKGYRYYVCSNGMRAAGGCQYHSWRHSVVEFVLLRAIQEVDYRTLLPAAQDTSKAALVALQEQKLIVGSELEKAKRERERVIDLLVEFTDSPGLGERLARYDVEVPRLEAELARSVEAVAAEKDRQRHVERDYKAAEVAFQEWADLQKTKDATAAFDARARLAALLRRVVNRIEFTPNATGYTHGTLDITLVGIDDYHREVIIGSGRKTAEAFKVIDRGIDDPEYSGDIVEWVTLNLAEGG